MLHRPGRFVNIEAISSYTGQVVPALGSGESVSRSQVVWK
jgi:hypothetical protein